MKHLSAPRIERYLFTLEHEYRMINCHFSYNEKTYQLIDEIFEELKQIAPINEYGTKTLWLHTDRGTIEDYGSFQEAREYDDVQTYEQFQQNWLAEYPNEEYWYHFSAAEDPATGYKTIFVGRRFIFEVDPSKERSFPYDASEFAEWLLDQVKDCIAQVKAGTYMQFVDQHLPPEHRAGTLMRRDLWGILPEYKDSDLGDITIEEIQKFLEYAREGTTPRVFYPIFTANEFYRCCALGYRANLYSGWELTPKKQYYKHADGRDNGLKDVEPDDPEAFRTWITDRSRLGGHPWEVCRGGNSTHIDLFVHYSEDGYWLTLAGNSISRYIETIRFYIALRNAGYAVELCDMESLAKRLKGTEKIGIVPSGIIPIYCSDWFPDEEIIDFMNLPYEERDKVAAKCVWQPLETVTLAKDHQE